jgi:hypothetical protein
MPISVDSKRLTGKLSLLDATLTKNTRGRGTSLSPKPLPPSLPNFALTIPAH